MTSISTFYDDMNNPVIYIDQLSYTMHCFCEICQCQICKLALTFVQTINRAKNNVVLFIAKIVQKQGRYYEHYPTKFANLLSVSISSSPAPLFSFNYQSCSSVSQRLFLMSRDDWAFPSCQLPELSSISLALVCHLSFPVFFSLIMYTGSKTAN